MSDDEERPDDEPGNEECLIEATDEGDDVWSPFDAEYGDVELGAVPKAKGEDGLPGYSAPVEQSDIPALNPRTLVCMGIYSEFVLRDQWGEIVVRFPREKVQRSAHGIFRVDANDAMVAFRTYIDDAVIKMASQEAPDRKTMLGQLVEKCRVSCCGPLGFGSPVQDDKWVEVEPIRPPCIHYARQATQAAFNPANREYPRLCSARRTTEGAMMGVGNLGLWACDMRCPRDAETERVLDNFDVDKEEQGKNRTYLSIFDMKPQQGGAGGILGGNGGEV